MADSKSDIVMMFTDKNGSPVWAESTLAVLTSDKFMDGFNEITQRDHYSNFFEVTNFSFAVALKPQDQGVGALSRSAHPSAHSGAAQAAPDQFSRWRSATNAEYRDIKFPLEFDTFTFTRFIDGASPIFFSACCNQESFRSATLVRRTAVGQIGGDERKSEGFLRIEFKDVLLTGVNWDDGDMVTESCTFICKAMRVRYKQQRADSHLQPPSEAVWDQKKDGQVSQSGGA